MYKQIDKTIDSIIRKRFLTGLMSDAKWIKLLDHLVQNADAIKRLEFKSLDGTEGMIYISPESEFNFDYWRNGFEGMTSLNRWLAYKEIEFVRCPHIFTERAGQTEMQDVEGIAKVISEIGTFDIFVEKGDLILQCYK